MNEAALSWLNEHWHPEFLPNNTWIAVGTDGLLGMSETLGALVSSDTLKSADLDEVVFCFIKCVVFSILLVSNACYVGFKATGGSTGVGKAGMRSVVSNITILFAADLLLTSLFDVIPYTK